MVLETKDIKRDMTEHALGNISGAVTIDADDGKVQVGTLDGDITGFTFNNLTGKPIFLQLNNPAEEHAIVSADATANEFEVTGDVTHKLTAGDGAFVMSGSTGNDGSYTALSQSHDVGTNRTTIGVDNVASDEDDGDITISGYGIVLDVDYTIGMLPLSGKSTIYVYEQGGDKYAVIAPDFKAV